MRPLPLALPVAVPTAASRQLSSSVNSAVAELAPGDNIYRTMAAERPVQALTDALPPPLLAAAAAAPMQTMRNGVKADMEAMLDAAQTAWLPKYKVMYILALARHCPTLYTSTPPLPPSTSPPARSLQQPAHRPGGRADFYCTYQIQD
jgi:hypothetical protein